ncbi:MAG: hypothetical protein U1E14_14130 [Geminicoccaceae bacterium]
MRGAVLLLLAVGLPGLAVAADAPAALSGRWTGTIAESTLADVQAGNAASFELRPNTGGFALVWSIGGTSRAEASFEPAPGRPGVYQVAEGGLMSMFGSEKPTDPLVGGNLLWARAAGPTLIVYGLAIADGGGYHLDRIAFTVDGDSLAVAATERRQNDQNAALATSLKRQP